MIKRVIIFVILLFFYLVTLGQIKFPKESEKIVKNDSTFLKVEHPTFYSYFKQHLDSVFIDFDSHSYN